MTFDQEDPEQEDEEAQEQREAGEHSLHALAARQLDILHELRHIGEDMHEAVRLLHHQSQLLDEYRAQIGEPVRSFVVMVKLALRILGYIIGALITLVGLREVWEFVLNKYLKP